jgi:putative drug exporter of the RND superfamily
MDLWQRLAGAPTGRRGAWLVVVAWLAVGAAAGPLAQQVSDVYENDVTAWVPRAAESTRARERAARFPGAQELTAVVVYARAGGLTDADRAKAAADRRVLAGLIPGRRVQPPVPSPDGQALLLRLPLDGRDEDAAYDATVRIRRQVSADGPPGLQVKVTGPAGFMVDAADAFGQIDTALLLATVAVVAVLLLLTYRSPVLWLLPLVAVFLANGIASAAVYLLASNGTLTVNGQSGGILTVLVFGAGTDYALLLVARYREELHRHADPYRAMAGALRRAGPVLLASGATVIAGLLCLLAADMNNTRSLGPVGALGIACALLAMTTLLPALLVLGGRWLFWPRIPRPGSPLHPERTVWARVGGHIARRPRPVWVATAVALAALAAGAIGMRTGIPGQDAYTTTPESIAGQQLLARHYPAGAATPAEVTANATAASAVTATVRGTPGVAAVLPATYAGELMRVGVVLADPADSPAAERTVQRLRAGVHAIPSADALVGGLTASNLDVATAARHDRATVIPLVLAVVFVVLVVLLRALVAPLLLLATVVLSFLAALGASWLTADRLLGFPAFDHQLVLIGFVFLVALGIDYNIFLMTRVREEAGRLGHRPGVLRGLAATGGVITSAGLVLAATFAVLSVLPVTWIVELGVLVAVGVLLDTFVVRPVLVPALALDAGPAIWWPSQHPRGHQRQQPVCQQGVQLRPPGTDGAPSVDGQTLAATRTTRITLRDDHSPGWVHPAGGGEIAPRPMTGRPTAIRLSGVAPGTTVHPNCTLRGSRSTTSEGGAGWM